jgi:hypothetical protein
VPPVSTVEIYGLADVDAVSSVSLNGKAVKFAKDAKLQVTGGRCYGHNFGRFRLILVK